MWFCLVGGHSLQFLCGEFGEMYTEPCEASVPNKTIPGVCLEVPTLVETTHGSTERSEFSHSDPLGCSFSSLRLFVFDVSTMLAPGWRNVKVQIQPGRWFSSKLILCDAETPKIPKILIGTWELEAGKLSLRPSPFPEL